LETPKILSAHKRRVGEIESKITHQKMKPKKESKSEDISASRSEKKGTTSAMMKAPIQVAARMAAQVPHPLAVLPYLCLELSKMRKCTNRAVTLAYKTPRKIRVGIMKEKATSFSVWLPRDPKAGAVTLWSG
jgi:hypothetical protein